MYSTLVRSFSAPVGSLVQNRSAAALALPAEGEGPGAVMDAVCEIEPDRFGRSDFSKKDSHAGVDVPAGAISRMRAERADCVYERGGSQA